MRSVLIGPLQAERSPTRSNCRRDPGFLHRLALEGHDSFVKGEITLESNQLILRIYGRTPHRDAEVANFGGDFRQRYRCYRRNARIINLPHLVTGHPLGVQTELRRRRRPARCNSDRSGC